MDDRRALMAAIIANPDEDTPRLAFADWLDEHGDEHDHGRAEFIRLQCELARFPDVESRAEKQQRATEIHATHHKEWLGPIAPWPQPVEFARGLVDHWFDLVATFLDEKYQRRLCEWLPRVGVKRLLLSGVTTRNAEVAALPALEWFVEWCWIEAKLADAGLGELARTPHGTRVSQVLLTHLRCTDAGLAALAESTAFPNLRTLGLRAFIGHASYTHAGIIRILERDRFPKLDSLELVDPAPSGFVPTAFYDTPALSRLRTLFAPPADTAALCRCRHLTNLQFLQIGHSAVRDEDMLTLLDNPAFAMLKALTLASVNRNEPPLSAQVMDRLRDRFGARLKVM